jgi:glyoxylase-like metal-dependent hydrolase (beta-lactamase superfamily II)
MGALNLVRGSGRRSASICKADLLFEDGERLDAWGLDARIVYLPGHTRGSIAVLTAGGALVAGDVFANRRRPAVSPFIENVVAYRESLFKAKALAASVVTVYPGHGASFPGAAIAGIEL